MTVSPNKVLPFRMPATVGDKSVSANLSLTNEGSGHCLFAVKTTQPRAFSVKPKKGSIAPQTSVQVRVTVRTKARQMLLSDDAEAAQLRGNEPLFQLQLRGCGAAGATASWDDLDTPVDKRMLCVRWDDAVASMPPPITED